VLTDAFYRWLPYSNVLWALEIALNLVLLRQGRWQAATKWSQIALNLAGIVIGYFLLSGPSIVALSPAALQATGLFDANTAAALSAVAGRGARTIIAIVMVVEGAEAVKDVVRLILRRR
jgi:hypothetical protein